MIHYFNRGSLWDVRVAPCTLQCCQLIFNCSSVFIYSHVSEQAVSWGRKSNVNHPAEVTGCGFGLLARLGSRATNQREGLSLYFKYFRLQYTVGGYQLCLPYALHTELGTDGGK
jgi:hypothetical protein